MKKGEKVAESPRISDWERKEELVLKTLQDLRLSSDAALKATGDLSNKLVIIEERLEQRKNEMIELKAKLDRISVWLMGIMASIFIFFVQWAFGILTRVADIPLPK